MDLGDDTVDVEDRTRDLIEVATSIYDVFFFSIQKPFFKGVLREFKSPGRQPAIAMHLRFLQNFMDEYRKASSLPFDRLDLASATREIWRKEETDEDVNTLKALFGVDMPGYDYVFDHPLTGVTTSYLVEERLGALRAIGNVTGGEKLTPDDCFALLCFYTANVYGLSTYLTKIISDDLSKDERIGELEAIFGEETLERYKRRIAARIVPGIIRQLGEDEEAEEMHYNGGRLILDEIVKTYGSEEATDRGFNRYFSVSLAE